MKKGKLDIKEGLIILMVGLIFVILICGIVYHITNKETTTISSLPKEAFNSSTLENSLEVENINTTAIIEEDAKEEIEVLGIDSKFKKLDKAAIYSIKLEEQNKMFEYDLDNDGKINTLLIDTKENIIKYDNEQEFRNVFYEKEEYISHTVYVVDINKNDKYLDIIIFSKGKTTENYFILKNIDGNLELMESKFGYGLGVNKIEAYHIYLDNNNKMIWLNEVEANVFPIVTTCYYEINEESKEIEEKKIDILNFENKEFETRDNIYFTNMENLDVYNFEDLKNNHEILPKGTKFEILDVDETGDYKVKLEDGRTGYIFAKYGHL